MLLTVSSRTTPCLTQILPLVLLSTLLLLQPALSHADQPPNIVILFADDLGYADVGYQGGIPQTPNLDALAASSVKFTDFYSNQAVCSPSRAALLTGRDCNRVGMYNWRPAGAMHLREMEVTLPELLKPAGYHTGVFGKWHLGRLSGTRGPTPHSQGFDYAFLTSNNASPSHLNPDNFTRNGTDVGELDGYSCQLVVDEALTVLDTLPPGEPFFQYLAFHEPHKPIASPPEMVANYDYPVFRANYYANVENLDDAIGRYLDALSQRGLRENTLVLFASDNGPTNPGHTGPFSGGKNGLYEGGIRVPGILSWPEEFPDPKVIETPAGIVDILPTICAAAGIEPPSDRVLDGVNLLPHLRGQPLERPQPLFWYFYNPYTDKEDNMAVAVLRDGDYSLVATDEDVQRESHTFRVEHMPVVKGREFDRMELFNLRDDPGQSQDISAEEPEIFERMKTQLRERVQDALQEGPDWRDSTQVFQEFLDNSGVSAPNDGAGDDFDLDTFENILEFLAGTNAAGADAAEVLSVFPPGSTSAYQRINLRYSPQAYPVAMQLWSTSDFQSWNLLAAKTPGHYPGFVSNNPSVTVRESPSGSIQFQDARAEDLPALYYQVVVGLEAL
jgi:arylsulfatase A